MDDSRGIDGSEGLAASPDLARQPADSLENSCDLSVLIVAYNSAALIEKCILSIEDASPTSSCEILLVDNGDGSTEELVARRFPHVRIIPSKGNVGFAAGNNLLARHALSDRFLLLNPDMVLEAGAIDALLRGAKTHPDGAGWGGVTVDEAGRPDTGNAIAMPSLREFGSIALGRSRIGNSRPEGIHGDAIVEVLVGGFVMFDRAIWDEFGGLDERYFLYCEEVDLFHRLSRKGKRVWRISDARGFHAVAHGNNFSPARLLYRTAGTAEFVRSHWSPVSARMALFLIWLAAFERYIAGKVLGRWRPHLEKMAAGYRGVALKPHYWIHGYDKQRGLMARQYRGQVK